jgi:hypothetical protein
VSIVESSELKLPKISRLHMGDYLCVASNGIPPSTSKKYRIRVQCKYVIENADHKFESRQGVRF